MLTFRKAHDEQRVDQLVAQQHSFVGEWGVFPEPLSGARGHDQQRLLPDRRPFERAKKLSDPPVEPTDKPGVHGPVLAGVPGGTWGSGTAQRDVVEQQWDQREGQ